MRVVATDLRFPEGPVLDRDGSILVTEIAGGSIARIQPETGVVDRIVECGGGPNGAAFGPDGRLYVCNNGGLAFIETDGITSPAGALPGNEGGAIQTVDLVTGDVEELYVACGEHRLLGPNDIVFDADGGFYFTDYGRGYERHRAFGAVYYAVPDGGAITEVLFPLAEPNGIGLSPSGETLYVALTPSRSIWSWEIVSPGVVRRADGPLRPAGGTLVAGLAGHQPVDSFAVDSQGNICIGTLGTGAVTVISPDGDVLMVRPVPVPDAFVTNVCIRRGSTTAYVTSSGRGILYETELAAAGLALNHESEVLDDH